MINGVRWYRLFFMLGASFLGIIGVVLTFSFFIIKICSIKSFGVPYFIPFAPLSPIGLKNSIIKVTTKNSNQREPYLSNNTTKLKEEN